jgi:PTH2 family peptidyl-tRNA hydrolase
MADVKQVILVRRDLRNKEGRKIRCGKLMAQASHASMLWIRTRLLPSGRTPLLLSAAEHEWFFGEGFTKIVLGVDSLEELESILREARSWSIKAEVVLDAGKTEFAGPTTTCAAIGPDFSSDIDRLTGHLKPY